MGDSCRIFHKCRSQLKLSVTDIIRRRCGVLVSTRLTGFPYIRTTSERVCIVFVALVVSGLLYVELRCIVTVLAMTTGRLRDVASLSAGATV